MQKREKGQKSQEKERSCNSSVPTAPSSPKSAQKKDIGIRKNFLSLLSNREETKGEEAIVQGGLGSEIEGYEDSYYTGRNTV